MHSRIVSSFFYLLSFTFLLFAGFFIIQRFQKPSLAFTNVPPVVQAVEKNLPTQIQIVSINLSLPVITSQINNGEWQTTEEGVSYLLGSSRPENNNAIFYGHNFPHLLGKLDNVSIGDRIVLTFMDGSRMQYKVVEKKRVKPSDVSILKPSQEKILTLYTCIGFMDNERLVVVAK